MGNYRNLWGNPPKNKQELLKFTGTYNYEDIKDGFVRILGDWQKENIVPMYIPLFHPKTNKQLKIHCHKKVHNNLLHLFSTYVVQGYAEAYPIRMIGCFAARHKMSNPKRSLSLHAYGVAVDINWDKNKVGSSGDIPAGIVALFKQFGWSWGGFWTKPKDPMHFQYKL